MFPRTQTNPAKVARDRRDAELRKITTEALPDHVGATQMRWEVRRGGVLIGFVQQFKREAGMTHPVQASPLDWSRHTVFAGSFYGPRGFQDAVDAVANYLK